MPPKPRIESLRWVEHEGDNYPLPWSAQLTADEYRDIMRMWAWIETVSD